VQTLREQDDDIGARALELAILCVSRSNEELKEGPGRDDPAAVK
jgi:hypothetical protein